MKIYLSSLIEVIQLYVWSSLELRVIIGTSFSGSCSLLLRSKVKNMFANVSMLQTKECWIWLGNTPLLWLRIIGPCLKDSIAAAAASTSLSNSGSILSQMLLEARRLDRYGKSTGSGRRLFALFFGAFSGEEMFCAEGGGNGALDSAWIKFGRYCASTIHSEPFPRFCKKSYNHK